MKASLQSYPARVAGHEEPQAKDSSKKGDKSDSASVTVPHGMKTLKNALASAIVVGSDISRFLEYLKLLPYDGRVPSKTLFDHIKERFPHADDHSAKVAADQMESFLAQKFAQKANPPLKLPEIDSGYEKYEARGIHPELGRKENPVEFYLRVWGDYARQGLLYQDLLTERDDKIVHAIRGFCYKEKSRPNGNPDYFDVTTILPPPKSARTDAAEQLERRRRVAREHAAMKRK